MKPHTKMGVLAVALILGVPVAVDAGQSSTSSPDTIRGCYGGLLGVLRVVESADDCRRNETALAWNAEGPQGPVGVDGATGPVGPQVEPGTPGSDASHSLQVVQAAQGNGTVSSQVTAVASCPDNTTVTGGGFTVFPPGAGPGTLGDVELITVYTSGLSVFDPDLNDDNGWTVEAFGPANQSWGIRAYAYCLG